MKIAVIVIPEDLIARNVDGLLKNAERKSITWRVNIMTGWKTKTAAVGGVLIGLGTIIAGISFDPFAIDANAFQTGSMMILGALGVAGVGHKIEKSTK